MGLHALQGVVEEAVHEKLEEVNAQPESDFAFELEGYLARGRIGNWHDWLNDAVNVDAAGLIDWWLVCAKACLMVSVGESV